MLHTCVKCRENFEHNLAGSPRPMGSRGLGAAHFSSSSVKLVEGRFSSQFPAVACRDSATIWANPIEDKSHQTTKLSLCCTCPVYDHFLQEGSCPASHSSLCSLALYRICHFIMSSAFPCCYCRFWLHFAVLVNMLKALCCPH